MIVGSNPTRPTTDEPLFSHGEYLTTVGATQPELLGEKIDSLIETVLSSVTYRLVLHQLKTGSP